MLDGFNVLYLLFQLLLLYVCTVQKQTMFYIHNHNVDEITLTPHCIYLFCCVCLSFSLLSSSSFLFLRLKTVPGFVFCFIQ